MNTFLQKKSTQIILIIIATVYAIYTLYGFVHMARYELVKQLAREFGAAVEQLDKSSPGIERAQIFVDSLRKIDTDGIPMDVKQALQDYISAFQQSIDAFKTGRDTQQFDLVVAQAKQRLIISIKRCE